MVVGLCDGETSMEVPGLREGQAMPHQQAQAVSDALMAEWRRKNPNARWDDAPPVQVAQAGGAPQGEQAPGAAAIPTGSPAPTATGPKSGAQAGGAPSAAQVQTGIYSAFGPRDDDVWRKSTDKFVDDGNKIFHSAGALGGTIGVSCDMCHPNAANTHPETYPKYQVQLGRVAMLRDMINWCIENPVRGKPLPDGDVKMKALESYILAQRKGVPLDYGAH